MMKSLESIRRSFASGERRKRRQDLGQQGFTLGGNAGGYQRSSVSLWV